jgi:hypothetical protein
MGAMEIKYLFVPFEMKEADAAAGTFEGYASVFGNVDLGKDVVLKGAFRKSIKAQKGVVPLYANHNHRRGDNPIGTAQVEEDEKGLHTLGFPLVNDVVAAKETMALAKAGAMRGMSIGYLSRVASYDEKTGVRTIKEADLFEVSILGTGHGMNPLAGVSSVKSLGEFADAEALAEALIEGKSFTPEFARELALLAFPRVSFDADEAKSVLESIRNLVEVMKS